MKLTVCVCLFLPDLEWREMEGDDDGPNEAQDSDFPTGMFLLSALVACPIEGRHRLGR
ncbi:hypothetical protein DBR06_SOUSAS9610107 [Sousa chinensis]|nr:hypothetical protein DBR06_SOUSAS9610107 [Sousa chinensis]